MSSLANIEDPDEMPHIVAFHQCQHCLVRQNRLSYKRERRGSVVQCLNRDQRVAGSSLPGVTALIP